VFCAFLLPATLMCGCVQSKPAWVCTPGLSPQQTDAGMLTVSWSKVPVPGTNIMFALQGTAFLM
jgi:hypothetical protein